MVENVVYLLGAGFSAPLGLPVLGNFLEKSKDLIFRDPEKFNSFTSVINQLEVFHNAFMEKYKVR